MQIKKKSTIGHAYKCGGIPMLSDKSLYEEIRRKLMMKNSNYKRNVEKYFGDLEIKFPWDDE